MPPHSRCWSGWRSAPPAATTRAAPGPTIQTGTPDAQFACIAAVNRNMPGANATVSNSDFSEAGTLAKLTSSNGETWRCLASNDGIVEDLSVVE